MTKMVCAKADICGIDCEDKKPHDEEPACYVECEWHGKCIEHSQEPSPPPLYAFYTCNECNASSCHRLNDEDRANFDNDVAKGLYHKNQGWWYAEWVCTDCLNKLEVESK